MSKKDASGDTKSKLMRLGMGFLELTITKAKMYLLIYGILCHIIQFSPDDEFGAAIVTVQEQL